MPAKKSLLNSLKHQVALERINEKAEYLHSYDKFSDWLVHVAMPRGLMNYRHHVEQCFAPALDRVTHDPDGVAMLLTLPNGSKDFTSMMYALYLMTHRDWCTDLKIAYVGANQELLVNHAKTIRNLMGQLGLATGEYKSLLSLSTTHGARLDFWSSSGNVQGRKCHVLILSDTLATPADARDGCAVQKAFSNALRLQILRRLLPKEGRYPRCVVVAANRLGDGDAAGIILKSRIEAHKNQQPVGGVFIGLAPLEQVSRKLAELYYPAPCEVFLDDREVGAPLRIPETEDPSFVYNIKREMGPMDGSAMLQQMPGAVEEDSSSAALRLELIERVHVSRLPEVGLDSRIIVGLDASIGTRDPSALCVVEVLKGETVDDHQRYLIRELYHGYRRPAEMEALLADVVLRYQLPLRKSNGSTIVVGRSAAVDRVIVEGVERRLGYTGLSTPVLEKLDKFSRFRHYWCRHIAEGSVLCVDDPNNTEIQAVFRELKLFESLPFRYSPAGIDCLSLAAMRMTISPIRVTFGMQY